MSDVITIFQDFKQNIKQYREHFPVIEEFKQLFGEQNLILQTDGSIQVKNYVGFFQKGKTKVQVLPKIYSGIQIEKTEIENSLAFLFRLLQWSGYISFKDLDDLDITSNQNNVFEIFIRIFIQNFLREFNKAPHYEYISRVENQQIIKGKILFTETIKQNIYTSHQHVVEFDDFSMDNRLNQLFKYIIQELILSTEDGKNKMLLKQGITLLEDVNLLPMSPEFFNSIQFNRQNQQYKNLFNFAKLFFYNNQPGMSSGKEHTFSFLVSLNLLFEKTIHVFLKNIESRIPDLLVKYQYCKYFGYEDKLDKFPLKPDFAIIDKTTNATVAILDTKFKNPFNEAGFPSIADSDLYQLTTYSCAHNCNLLFLIYPIFIGSKIQDTLITTYTLKISPKQTQLCLLQIDITNSNVNEVQERLLTSIVEILIHSLLKNI
jgi:5-methylcytosine-specific restriction enzyme subunit McrC